VKAFGIVQRRWALSVALVLALGTPNVLLGQPATAELDRRVADALKHNGRRMLSSDRQSTWEILHGVLGFGGDFRIRAGLNGSVVRAVDFICNEASVGGQRLFFTVPHGVKALEGYGAQGHPDQFLAIFAQADVPLTQSIKVDGAVFKVADLVSQAQADYDAGREASWTLIALVTYLPLNAVWTNQAGRPLTIADLVAAEVDVQPQTAACGGTHNLYALAYALRRYKASGAAITGAWQQAETKLAQYVQLARSYQNRDGSFSSNYFVGPGWPSDPETVLYSTGHMLEWLMIALPESEWHQPWIANAFEALLTAHERVKTHSVDCGSLYHACHALRLYQQGRRAMNEKGLAGNGRDEQLHGLVRLPRVEQAH